MGKRRALKLVQPANKVLETREISDKSKLHYSRAVGHADAVLNAAAQARANAMQLASEVMLATDKLNPDDGWKLNVDKMRYERYPKLSEG